MLTDKLQMKTDNTNSHMPFEKADEEMASVVDFQFCCQVGVKDQHKA